MDLLSSMSTTLSLRPGFTSHLTCW
jgi:hypothetical protein